MTKIIRKKVVKANKHGDRESTNGTAAVTRNKVGRGRKSRQADACELLDDEEEPGQRAGKNDEEGSPNNTDDPVRMYLMQMGRIPLLSRAEEIDAAKEIAGESGRFGDVFNPATGDFFEAVRGGGARHNGAPITVTSQDAIAGAKLLSSRRTFQKRDWTDAVEHAEFVFLGSMAFRLALVAAGRYDATITLAPKSDWDIAAGDLIITEAGGVITQADGSNLRYNRPSVRQPDVIAAGPALHRRLVEGLAERPAH